MKVNWINEKEALERLIKEGVSYERIGRQYEVSGNAIKKAAKKLGIELEYKRKINPDEHFNKGKKIKENTQFNDTNHPKEKNRQIKEKTLGDFVDGEKYLVSKCNSIRKDARRTIEESGREKVCAYCHNHEFDDILEVHHLKGILEFDSTAKIKEINEDSNLVWLCPNHHKMLEMGLIKLE